MAEFPDIFACVSCEKALFVDEKDRASEKYECPFCHHEHTPEEALGEDKPETPETAENAPIEATASEEPLEPNPAAAEPAAPCCGNAAAPEELTINYTLYVS